MSFRKGFSVTLFGWTVGAAFSPGWLMFELAWEVSPASLILTVPFFCFSVERFQTDYDFDPLPWGWSLLRLTIWKTEFRLDLDLNIWGLGVTCVELDDLGVYVGPFNIQIETGKMYNVNFPPGVPTMRVFFPADRSVEPWPPRCDCDPSEVDVDDA
jgi:hypothetical protein